MKKVVFALVAIAAALVTTPVAIAENFSFEFLNTCTSNACDHISASGTLIASEIGASGIYNVTAGTITLDNNGSISTGTLDPNPGSAGSVFDGADDLLSPTGLLRAAQDSTTPMLLDTDGLLFTVNGLYGSTNIWSGDNNGWNHGPNGNYSISIGIWDSYGSSPDQFSFSVADEVSAADVVTPEPSSFLLFGSGLLGLADRQMCL